MFFRSALIGAALATLTALPAAAATALPLLLAALGGLGFVARRRKAA